MCGVEANVGVRRGLHQRCTWAAATAAHFEYLDALFFLAAQKVGPGLRDCSLCLIRITIIFIAGRPRRRHHGYNVLIGIQKAHPGRIGSVSLPTRGFGRILRGAFPGIDVIGTIVAAHPTRPAMVRDQATVEFTSNRLQGRYGRGSIILVVTMFDLCIVVNVEVVNPH